MIRMTYQKVRRRQAVAAAVETDREPMAWLADLLA